MKQKLEIENFSGRTHVAIEQDFFATIYMCNFAAVLAWEAQEKVDEKHKNKENKYTYKINTNHEIGLIRDQFIKIMILPQREGRDKKMDKVYKLMIKRLSPISPNRSFERKNPRNSKFHHNKKSNL